MIYINLLPSKKDKRGARPGSARAAASAGPSMNRGNVVVAAVALVLFGVAGYYGWATYQGNQSAARKLEQAKKNHETLKKGIAELESKVEGLAEMNTALNNELAALSAIAPSDRLIWAEKLHQLASLIPDNVYLTKIKVDEQVKEIITEESRKALENYKKKGSKGAPPRLVKTPKISHTMTIEGITYSDRVEERPQLMLDFFNAIREYEAPRAPGGDAVPFMEGFRDNVTIRHYYRDWLEDVEVTRFAFELTTVSREG